MVIIIKCTLGVFIALAFMADFSLAAPEFYQRTHRVRLKNLGTPNKKSSHKIKHKKILRAHIHAFLESLLYSTSYIVSYSEKIP